MVAAPSLIDGFRAEPPRAANVRDHPNDSLDVVLGVDATGHYFLNKHPIDSAALGPKLRALLGADPMNHVLYVKADRTLDYAKVSEVMDVARENGAVVVGLITQQSPHHR